MSFSLYLVHEPMLISVRHLSFLLSSWGGLLIDVPISLLVATLFARLVEQPAHMSSRLAGGRLAAMLDRPRASQLH